MDSLEGLSIDDYIDGLENLIETSSILFLSKISGNRVCAFLSNKSLVEKTTNKTIKVKDCSLTIRPLMEKNKRVVISNVCPVIPHEVLLEALIAKGIKLASQMRYIRAGLNKPGRSHILSFRRQIYIKEESVSLLPESLQINFDETSYWVYLTTDSTCCFICKQSGHIAKLCPKNNDVSNHIPPSQQDSREEFQEIPGTPQAMYSPINLANLQENPNRNSNELKRPAPPSTNSEASTISFSTHQNELLQHTQNPESAALTPNNKEFKLPRKPIQKKPKKEEIQQNNTTNPYETKVNNTLSKAKQIFYDNPSDHSLSFQQFKEFIVRHQGRVNSEELAKEYTSDIENLITTINIVYAQIDDRSIKSKLTRIVNKLKTKINGDSGTDSEYSQHND